MKITLKTKDSLMYATLNGKSADVVLPMMMPYVRIANMVDPKRKVFYFTKDIVIPLTMTREEDSIRIFCWEGSYAVVED